MMRVFKFRGSSRAVRPARIRRAENSLWGQGAVAMLAIRSPVTTTPPRAAE